jgi:2-dehydro-3-deoxy-D-arabinonate dehydratase
MHLFKTLAGPLLHHDAKSYLIDSDWDHLINRNDLHEHLRKLTDQIIPIPGNESERLRAKPSVPVGTQEVWAAGVTYLRSRDARMEESKESGAADVYQRVYEAERPELFFKANPQRLAAHDEEVFIRKDSTWNVPEPELTLYINSSGIIQGYTIGNDMSSRSIEGENPLYLPQAKIYERSCSLGPCLFVPAQPISPETKISIAISRAGVELFANSILLNRMKRTLPELASWLFRGCHFPQGCFLMTGTGIVPPNDFTLAKGDQINIQIAGIGELVNTVGVL